VPAGPVATVDPGHAPVADGPAGRVAGRVSAIAGPAPAITGRVSAIAGRVSATAVATAQANDRRGPDAAATTDAARAGVDGPRARRSGSVRTLTPASSKVTTTDPSRSVR
jgi:hypothetical protein